MELLADRDPEEARKTPRPRPRAHDGGGPPLRGHGEPGHGRRDHGALRRAARPRGPRRCGRATRRCGCRSRSRSTRRVSSARTGCPSRSAWASTPARWSSAPSGPICTWITRRSVRRRTWPPAWSRWRRPARSCSPRDPAARRRLRAGRGPGPVAVKGLADPVEIYALTGASALRTRLHAAAARGLTRFVGRDAEIEQIRRALALAHDGHGQLVAVVGNPAWGSPASSTSSPTPTAPRTGSSWKRAPCPTARRPATCRSSTSSRPTSRCTIARPTARSARR